MPKIDLLSLLVSVIAVTISAVALIRSRKLAEKQIELEQQQADLAKKQLEQIHAQEEYAKLAHIDVELTGYGSDYDFYIHNDGFADATNVDLEWSTEPPRFPGGEVEEKLPIGRLKSGKSLRLMVAFHMGSPRYYAGVAKWKNPDGSEDSDEFELHL